MRNSTGCIFPMIGLFFAFVLIITAMFYNTSETVTFTVTGKERIVESSGESVTSKYLIFTNIETFENTDMMLIGKFNSSDVQGKFFIDSTYTATVYGWRIPFLSMYRNIGNNATMVSSNE